jgi:hypothetical protein
MSDTATKNRDFKIAEEALTNLFGQYKILHARTDPFGAVNAVAVSWEEAPVSFEERDSLPFFPNFVRCFTTHDVVNEVTVFLNRREEHIAAIAESFASNFEALNEIAAEPVGEYEVAQEPVQTKLEAAIDLIDGLERRGNTRKDLGEFSITELRKASRGLVKDGYRLKKPELIEQLLDAGVDKNAVLLSLAPQN